MTEAMTFENRKEPPQGDSARLRLDSCLTERNSLDIIKNLGGSGRENYSNILPEISCTETSRNESSKAPQSPRLDDKAERDLVDQAVTQLHLPENYRYRDGEDPAQKKLSYGVASMAVQLIGGIDAMDKLHHIKAYGPKFPFELPKGVSVERGADGNIKSINLGLPTDLSPSKLTDADVAHVHDLNTWLHDYEPRIDRVTEQIAQIKSDPLSVISAEDIPVGSVTRADDGKATAPAGLFDADGKLLNAVDANRVQNGDLPDGWSLKHLNQLSSRFSVSPDIVDPNLLVVDQTVQGQDVPWYGYQNAFTKDVGEAKLTEKTFKPDDYAVVGGDGEIRLVEASYLSELSLVKQAHRIGDEVMAVGMDAGLTASGAGEAGLALKGGEALYAGARTFFGLVKGRAGAIASGSLKATVGAAGVFNNAGVNETQTGRALNTARGAAFVLEAGASVVETGITKLTGFSLPNAENAIKIASETNPALRLVHDTGTLSFQASMPVAGVMIGDQLLAQVSRLGSHNADYVDDALKAYESRKALPRNEESNQ